jgi:hypothetical protein
MRPWQARIAFKQPLPPRAIAHFKKVEAVMFVDDELMPFTPRSKRSFLAVTKLPRKLPAGSL